MWLKTLSIISEGQHAAWNKLIKCKNEQQFRLEARKEKKRRKKPRYTSSRETESYTNILQDSEKYVHFYRGTLAPPKTHAGL